MDGGRIWDLYPKKSFTMFGVARCGSPSTPHLPINPDKYIYPVHSFCPTQRIHGVRPAIPPTDQTCPTRPLHVAVSYIFIIMTPRGWGPHKPGPRDPHTVVYGQVFDASRDGGCGRMVGWLDGLHEFDVFDKSEWTGYVLGWVDG